MIILVYLWYIAYRNFSPFSSIGAEGELDSLALSITAAPLRFISGTVLSKDLCMKDGVPVFVSLFYFKYILSCYVDLKFDKWVSTLPRSSKKDHKCFSSLYFHN